MDPKSIETLLRNDIEKLRLVPGTPLRQEELAARFGVSRLPVRRALDRLLAAGVVERRSDRSVVVKEFSTKEAEELVGLRVALETSALRLSLPRLDAGALRRARRANEAMIAEDDAAELEEIDIRFHTVLYGRCGNERMLRTIAELRREGRRIYALQSAGLIDRVALHAEHEALLAACEAGAVAAAVDALTAHLTATIAGIAQPQEEER